MGTRGPIPNRSNNLSRKRDAQRGDAIPIRNGRQHREPTTPAPEPEDHWDDMIKDLWVAAGNSGMAEFYETTDWAALRLYLEDLDIARKNQNYRGSTIKYQTILGQFPSFGFTEGDRRRMRIELHNKTDEDNQNAQDAAIAKLSDLARGKKTG